MHRSDSKENYFCHTRGEMLEFIPKASNRILDIGCGEGLFASQLKDESREIWGVELDQQSALLAKDKLSKVLIGPIEDVIELLPDNYFDCIICNDVIEHMVDPWKMLKKLESKLTDTGSFVCSIPNVLFWQNIYNLLIKRDWKYVDSGILDKTHLRFFTKKSIENFVNELGFELLYIEGINKNSTLKGRILNFILFILGFRESQYLQFACVFKSYDRIR